MHHDTSLIDIIAVGLSLAFVLGALAQRLKLSTLVGYLVAGICVGPFTPGFVADQQIANQLSELGVMLLMFGVGLHFSLEDLLEVKAIAIPGALVQIAAATLLGWGLAWTMGWPMVQGVVFGLALSVASTVVLLRALEERRLIDTQRGRIAVGWLIVEDLVMVLALVLLPALAQMLNGNESVAGHTQNAGSDSNAMLTALGWTLLKMTGFVAVMLVVGRRVIPWSLEKVAATGSARIVYSGCSWYCAWRGIRFGKTVRRLICIRCVLRRDGAQRLRDKSRCSYRFTAIAGCLRSTVLCGCRHAVQSSNPD